ncbi:MAG TPA: tetratricopeptide repeat protein [Gaiellaceae bacterium]|nr:tetratricopeptide repeat protein [Gaiellaceae bacterium]
MDARAAGLRGQGRWVEALELTDDPFERADLLNEQALFTGSADAREEAERELLRAEARLLQERGRIVHATFLAEREEDPRELQLFCRSLELAREAGDERLERWAEFWIGVVHQVVRDDHDASLPHFERAYEAAKADDDRLLRSYAVRHLGFAWYEQGRRDDGIRALEESLELRREDGFVPGVAAGLLTLGEIAAEEGRTDDARRLLTEAKEAADGSGASAFGRRIDAALEQLDS